ncbi:biotin transporter BioY [Roseivivax isoporae]|uniref:Biotin transporter n=1 Tax=Roseivivax isoporae LMG 25204 TaxID=1449351 RepID=X7F9Z4_9RHOB|nr:BioY family transporter [Roseivivax isoporae]ETX28931.1 biotin biosynthesis protein BioC [Roseivivax isoporae LMG 25204]
MERDVTFIALFAALIAILGLVPSLTLISGVPISAQSLGVMLAGTVLGAWRGALAATLVVVLVALGLPLLAGGRGGLGVFFGPTVGFLVGWIPAAFVAGLVTERLKRWPTFPAAAAGAVLGGILVLYIPGILGMAAILGKSLPEATLLSTPFIPGDILKAVLAGLVTATLARARPGSVPSRPAG